MMHKYVFGALVVVGAVWLFSSTASAQFGGGLRGPGGEPAFQAESAPGTNPTATGTDAIGIGDGTVAGDAVGDNAVLAIGARSTATADDTNDGINVLVTGAVGDAVQWVGRVEVVETCGRGRGR